MEDAVREGLTESPWAALKEQVILGGQSFLINLRDHLHGNSREQANLKRLQSRPTLAQAIQAVEHVKGESWSAFQNRHGDWGRDLVLYLGRKDCGLKLTELGQAAEGIDYVSVSSAVRRLEQRLAHDKSLTRHLQLAVDQLENK